jgi:hypothetical protein
MVKIGLSRFADHVWNWPAAFIGLLPPSVTTEHKDCPSGNDQAGNLFTTLALLQIPGLTTSAHT